MIPLLIFSFVTLANATEPFDTYNGLKSSSMMALSPEAAAIIEDGQKKEKKQREQGVPEEERRRSIEESVREATEKIRSVPRVKRGGAVVHPELVKMAKLNGDLNRHQDQRDLANRVLDEVPDHRDALNQRAIAHYGLKDYSSAIADATRVTRLDRDNVTAYTTRALAYYEKGDYLRAIEDSRRALHLDKNNDVAFATLRLAEGHVSSSRLAFTPAQREKADGVKREYFAKLEQEARAETAVVREAPRPTTTTGEAPAAVSAANAFRPGPEANLLSEAAAATARGQGNRAISLATEAININRRSSAAYQARAAAFSSVQQYSNAIKDADAAVKVDPDNVGALDTRASALLFLGRYIEAQQDCERSIYLNRSNPYGYVNCGRARLALGNLDKAVEDLNNARVLNRQFEEEYRQAIAERDRKGQPARKSAPREGKEVAAPSAPTRSIIATTAATVLGGLIIALGIIYMTTRDAWRGATTTTDAAPSDPSILGNYKILRKIAHGGMGVVYEAIDESLNRTVAIKRMRDEIKLSAPERRRFIQEARIVAALHHPNIVDIHTILERGDDLFLVFEHVKGSTLAETLRETGPLSMEEATRVTRGVVEALEYAHRHGIIHRDLKPSNIMLSEEGQPKVMDFGIARVTRDQATDAEATTVVGTPQYMAPEAEQGIVRPECDVYGLGACLYEMLTAKRVFGASDPSPQKIALTYPRLKQLRPDLPAALDALIAAALDPDPDKRPRTPAKFAESLNSIVDARVV